VDDQIYTGSGSAAAEIGHLRPGLSADTAEQTVESIASGWGIAAAAQARLASPVLTAQLVAQAAEQGNALAIEVLEHAVRTLGWAIAQAITLAAPELVVVGGGVSLMSPALFLRPLRDQTARYVFPPLTGSYEIMPAELGEEVVVHGALALASVARR
jgi:glucokinase